MVLTDFDFVYISNKRPDESVHRKLNGMIDRYLSDLKHELKRKSIHFSDDNEGSSWYQVIMKNDWYNIFTQKHL